MEQSAESMFLDAINDLFVAFDDSGALSSHNRVARDVTGYAEAELASMQFADLFAGDETEQVRAAMAEATENDSATVSVSLVAADERTVPYEFTIRQLPDDAPAAFAGVGRDITDRKATAKERDAVLNRMGDGFIAVDTNWDITYTNEMGAEILGKAMGRNPETTRFEGLHLWSEIPNAEETTSYEKYQQAMATGENLSFKTYSKAVDRWLNVRAFPSETGLSVYFYDITDQHRQQEQLETEERVLREMYEIIADRDREFSEKVNALLRLGRTELQTEYASLSRIEGDEYIFEYVDAANDEIQQGETVPVSATNCEIVAKDEETLVLGDIERDAPDETGRAGFEEWGISCYIGAPVFSGDELYGTFCFYGTNSRSGQFLDWEETFVDLMSRWVSYELERDQINSQLEEKNERLEQFASVLSHDIRNPLTVALGRLDVVRKEHTSEQFDVIERSLVRIESLIEDVLIHARQDESLTDPEDVELRSTVDQCWSFVDTDDAVLDVESDLTFRANSARLQRLLENLLRNAVEHGSDDATIRVGALADGSGFYVADDGPGIPEEKRTDVFESGYTETAQGTGFGLAIVKGIADAHGWDVTISESDGGGARFEITGVETSE